MPNILQGGNIGFGGGAGTVPGFISSKGMPKPDNDILSLVLQAISGQDQQSQMGQMAQQWVKKQTQMNIMRQMMGDEALASITLADTAGLTPDHMSNIMKTMLGQREISQKGLADAYDAVYKTNMMGTQRAQAETQRLAEWRRIKEIPDKVNVTVGNQVLSVDPKDALSHYAKMNDLPASYDTFKIAKGDPEFKSYLLEMAQAGSIKLDLGTELEKKKAFAVQSGQLYFKKDWLSDRDKVGSDTPARREISMMEDELKSKGEPIEHARKIWERDWTINQIKARGGEILKTKDGGVVKVVDKTVIITVKWPDGTIEEVKYGL
uniref:Uncharacterized protein n=1 Tax=viral metagenome TaxID=1070528 RepID=A0A6M3IGA8_9ZZZZ